MADLYVKVSHRLPLAEVLQRVKSWLSAMKEENRNQVSSFNEQWFGNEGRFSFDAQGFHISARVSVQPQQIVVDGDVPWLARNKIEDRIRMVLSEAVTVHAPSPTSPTSATPPVQAEQLPIQTPPAKKSFEEDVLDFFNPIKALEELWKTFDEW